MNKVNVPREPHAWYTPGQIFSWLQQQRYRVFNVRYDDHWYIVEARDHDNQWVALKVDPKTRTVFTWKLLAHNSIPHGEQIA